MSDAPLTYHGGPRDGQAFRDFVTGLPLTASNPWTPSVIELDGGRYILNPDANRYEWKGEP